MAHPDDPGSPLLWEESRDAKGQAAARSSGDIYTQDGSVDLDGNPAVRSKTGGWKTSAFILGTECCERLAYYGIATNLVVYFMKVLHQGNATAAKNVAVWVGTGYLTPLIGAFVADAYVGRFKTIAWFSTIYLAGLSLLSISSSVPSLTPPQCPPSVTNCPRASAKQLFLLYFSLYAIAFGMGGIKACVSAFGADQFDDTDDLERKKKGHFFNWFYLSITVGSLVATVVLVYIQDNISWSLGYAIPAVAMAIAISCFLLGARHYRQQKPSGSPLTRIAQVLVAACRKWATQAPADTTSLYGFLDEESVVQGTRKIEHTKGFKFLDKAATQIPSDTNSKYPPSPWRLCTVSQVEEVKQLARIMPIWASTIFFPVVFSQFSSLYVEQGTRMDTRMFSGFSMPPASMSVFEIMVVLLLVPLYDRVLVKLVRRYSGHPHGFTQLQRMGVGMFISIIASILACLLEMKRLRVAREFGLLDDAEAPVPLSIFWQVPQSVLLGVADMFTFIGQLDFFYDQAPESMRSLGTALAITTYGLGSYVNSIMIACVSSLTRSTSSPGWIPNDNLNLGHLDYYFGLTAFISAVNWIWYVRCARAYVYKGPTKNVEPLA